MTRSSLNGSSAGDEHDPEQLVEGCRVDPGRREAAGDVDVTGLVDGVREPGQAQVAAQEEAVDLVVVLVGVADDERRHRHRGVRDDERGDGLELLLPGQRHDELVVARPASHSCPDSRR